MRLSHAAPYLARTVALAAALLGIALANPSAATAQRGSMETSDAQVRADIFVQTLRAIGQFHQNEFADTLLWDAAIEGMLEALNDPYAAVFTPEEVAQQNEDNTGNYAGIGVTISQLNDLVTVTAVNRGFPADQVGMIEGDVIVEVDGVDTREATTSDVSGMIRGPVGTLVTVGVEREGYDDTIYFPITRAEVHMKLVHADLIADDILYITMDRFARNASTELDSILGANADAAGIVFDLRRNPGGFLDEALQMADLFIPPGKTLVSTRSRARGEPYRIEEEPTFARAPARLPSVPMVVLVDEFSASASEVLAGALQDYDRALVLGQRSFGKGLVQIVLDLPHGRRMQITNGTWHTPLGRSLHRPRDRQGRPLAEDVDTFPTVTTASGRELVAGGGIFPDLPIANDTLTTLEQRFLRDAAEKQIPIGLRLAEFGFEQAQPYMHAPEDPQIREDDFRAFLGTLRDGGADPLLLAEPEVESYLRWQARISMLDRLSDAMGGLGPATEARMRRDPALSEAVALLRESATQPELFAAAALEQAERERHADISGTH
ncbi:MAG: S41 family peptidase [Longimicrobiales bacterium]|nr:S41 family peptidase [Longimicrobiales bacterium]